MPISRYDNRKIAINDNKIYEDLFRNRGVKFIKQYTTPKLKYPTSEEISELTVIGITWSMDDRLWKMSEQYYGDPELWWIIAFYNQRPTEHHINIGDIIYVPTPLEKILKLIGV